ncbi:MAG: serine protease, partial [Clostridia bacterium]|nr:serine protease [Clostridia bacterium]
MGNTRKRAVALASAAVLLTGALFAFAGCVGRNGQDGRDFSLYAVYQELLESGEFSGTYTEFVKQYLSVNVTEEEGFRAQTINSTLTSIVSVSVICDYQGGFGSSMRVHSSGSGVIYSLEKSKGDAYIVTNCHVVYDAFPEKKTDDAGATYTRSSAPLTNNVYFYGMENSEYAVPFSVVG